MGKPADVSDQEVEELFLKLRQAAEKRGYHLNPDQAFTKALVRSLIVNQKRYGYQSCPCRLANGKREEDQDIICPCDYRDSDLGEFGCCFCALYVIKDILEGKVKARSIPERRPPKGERKMKKLISDGNGANDMKNTVWRCKVCGYLCARDSPPDQCPICLASKDRFEIFEGL
jgi:ferredoxin-thioredoxin reductase catalytic subunit